MRNLLVLIISGMLLFSSCGKKNSLPSGVLATDKMEAVMWDMMRADQFVVVYILPKDSSLKKETEIKKWHDSVYAVHKITEADFQKSFLYYKSHPRLLRQVMDSISISKQYETQEQTVPSTGKPINDSTGKLIQQKMEEERKKQYKHQNSK
jgi:hypothetical protein